ncbi:MAG: hypothetical protein ACOX2P_02240 [Bacillota bacterium]|jgi:hypothetical protein
MAERIRPQRTFTVSHKSGHKPLTSKGATRTRVLTGDSGYAAAEFNFLSTHFPPPLIITEPDEDTSSWQ